MHYSARGCTHASTPPQSAAAAEALKRPTIDQVILWLQVGPLSPAHAHVVVARVARAPCIRSVRPAQPGGISMDVCVVGPHASHRARVHECAASRCVAVHASRWACVGPHRACVAVHASGMRRAHVHAAIHAGGRRAYFVVSLHKRGSYGRIITLYLHVSSVSRELTDLLSLA